MDVLWHFFFVCARACQADDQNFEIDVLLHVALLCFAVLCFALGFGMRRGELTSNLSTTQARQHKSPAPAARPSMTPQPTRLHDKTQHS